MGGRLKFNFKISLLHFNHIFRLVEFVLDGNFAKLRQRSSSDEDVQDFIDYIEIFQVSHAVWRYGHLG